MLNIFIGFDPRQIVSYTALHTSITMRCSKPVAITPLVLETLPITRRGLTPFTFSRFLCPWLCNYEGWSLFLDSDMLVLGDMSELFATAQDEYDVMVVKNPVKFEWASLMLFNNAKCKVLTPEFVESGENPLNMNWAANIGELPAEWNHCVGYDQLRTDAKLVHFTQGVPFWSETKDSEYAQDWLQDAQISVSARPWQELMGNSVHAKKVYERLSRKSA